MDFEPVFVGRCVIYVDPNSVPHHALITAVWGQNSPEEYVEWYLAQGKKAQAEGASWATDEYIANFSTPEFAAQWKPPSLNLVYVSTDITKTDPYGRQLEQRATSITHHANQNAHGNYWVHL